jgi:hypothetical protein
MTRAKRKPIALSRRLIVFLVIVQIIVDLGIVVHFWLMQAWQGEVTELLQELLVQNMT